MGLAARINLIWVLCFYPASEALSACHLHSLSCVVLVVCLSK